MAGGNRSGRRHYRGQSFGRQDIAGAVTFALCNAGEASLAAGLIERQFSSDFSLDRLRQVLSLLAAAVFAAAISGLVGTLGFKLFHSSAAPSLTIRQHWLASDALKAAVARKLAVILHCMWIGTEFNWSKEIAA